MPNNFRIWFVNPVINNYSKQRLIKILCDETTSPDNFNFDIYTDIQFRQLSKNTI